MSADPMVKLVGEPFRVADGQFIVRGVTADSTSVYWTRLDGF
jgi:hypothetical protein